MKATVSTLLIIAVSAMEFCAHAGAPTVTTGGASNIGTTSADLNGSVNPNGLSTMAYFQWGASSSYGQTVPNPYLNCGSGATKLGVSVNPLGGLAPNTKYYYQLVAYNSGGTTYGNGTNFTTLPLAPTVSTVVATATNAFSAVFAGNVNPNGAATTAWYQWGTNTSYGSNTATINVGNGSSSVAVPFTVTNLNPNTTYHFQLVAENSGGTNFGGDQTFVTSPPPPPLIQSVVVQGGEISFTWQSASGQTYQVQYSTDLITWTDSGSPLPANSTFYDLPVGPCRFYRVVLLP
jgi:phosphodiesterase/alkaline phosphatase D-like protein